MGTADKEFMADIITLWGGGHDSDTGPNRLERALEKLKASGGVKSDAKARVAALHTIIMSDKTTITLSGISTHDVIKPQ